MSAQCGPGRRLSGPHGTVMEQYIEFFNGYINAYGVADFNHQDSKVDPDTGKKKPVYRWNFEELTNITKEMSNLENQQLQKENRWLELTEMEEAANNSN